MIPSIDEIVAAQQVHKNAAASINTLIEHKGLSKFIRGDISPYAKPRAYLSTHYCKTWRDSAGRRTMKQVWCDYDATGDQRKARSGHRSVQGKGLPQMKNDPLEAMCAGYAATPRSVSPLTLDVPAKYFMFGMYHYAAGLRAKIVATAVGVSLDPLLLGYASNRTPDAVPGALDWYVRL